MSEIIFFSELLCFFGTKRDKRGMGERRHEIDAYLLDNRNRTQKWDE